MQKQNKKQKRTTQSSAVPDLSMVLLREETVVSGENPPVHIRCNVSTLEIEPRLHL